MLRVSGQGASLHLVSDPAPFSGPMVDLGDGFDWQPQSPSQRLWPEGAIPVVEVWENDVWAALVPLSFDRWVGRVELGRCQRGRQLHCTGVCQPTSAVAAAERWELFTDRLEEGGRQAQVHLHGWVLDRSAEKLEETRLLVRLAQPRDALVALGRLGDEGLPADADTPLRLIIDAGEVHHGGRSS